jgi:ubiquinone/menaquinone biosynthesis C-methylase UbiE
MPAPYSEHYAELYDLFYSEKPYEQEAAFLHEQFRRHGVQPGGRILELACGTGQHAIRLAGLGYAVTATDYSVAMVACARKKVGAQTPPIRFEQRDMRELPVPTTPYDAAICLFDSLGYVQTDKAIAATLNGVNRSLRPGGVFILEFWHAPAMENGFDPVRVRRFQSGNDTILRISETELDTERSLAHVTYNVYELRNNSTYSHINERHSNRYFTVPEMDAWARQHGFTPLAAYPGFTCEGQVSEATWHVVAVWKKNAAHEIEAG